MTIPPNYTNLPLPRLRADIACPLCMPQSSALLDEGQLQRQGALTFVQLHPCGHTYCTRCFELLLRASAQYQHRRSLMCIGCGRQVLVPQVPVNEKDVAREIREYRFEPGNSLRIFELRLSILDLRERIEPGQFVIRSAEQANAAPGLEARDAVTPVWVTVSLPSHFERLLEMVGVRLRDGRLFYRLQSDGQPFDEQLILQILGPEPPPPTQIVDSQTPQPYAQPAGLGINVPTREPHFARENALKGDASSSSKPARNTGPKAAPVYGVAVDSLMGEFLLHLSDQQKPGRFFF